VTGMGGRPLVGVELDLWHADADGHYSNIHPGIPDWNLRGRLFTDEQGRYIVKTIVPPPYEIPKDGPTGRVVKALGRHFFRPAHLHVAAPPRLRRADESNLFPERALSRKRRRKRGSGQSGGFPRLAREPGRSRRTSRDRALLRTPL
jgi:protocatechuate 3,4-dioxygenase beta subunit